MRKILRLQVQNSSQSARKKRRKFRSWWEKTWKNFDLLSLTLASLYERKHPKKLLPSLTWIPVLSVYHRRNSRKWLCLLHRCKNSQTVVAQREVCLRVAKESTSNLLNKWTSFKTFSLLISARITITKVLKKYLSTTCRISS